MSKSQAWNTYNEAARKADAEYEATVTPLRANLAKDLREVEAKFDEKIVPLQIEKKENLDMLRAEYGDNIMRAQAKRRADIKTANDVLNAERKAEKAAAAA